jgi:translation initiation factor IF-2
MLNLVIKADVDGAAQAIADSLETLSSGRARLVHRGVGAIDEADVRRAAAEGALVIGFHTRPTPAAQAAAAAAQVEIRRFDTIYDLVEEVRARLDGRPPPDPPSVELGTAEVRRMLPRGLEIFAICMVTEGTLKRRCELRVFRDGVQVYYGRPAHLRRLGHEVDVVDEGQELELTFEYFRLQADDVLECVAPRR